jgi:hypothetical protein
MQLQLKKQILRFAQDDNFSFYRERMSSLHREGKEDGNCRFLPTQQWTDDDFAWNDIFKKEYECTTYMVARGY